MPCFDRDGQRVGLEKIFETGFVVEPNDCPAVLTLILRFLEAKEENQK